MSNTAAMIAAVPNAFFLDEVSILIRIKPPALLV
jgi:hypothetical protein